MTYDASSSARPATTRRTGAVKGKVEILRDRSGIPHIYANRTDDLFFGLGLAAAEDRLWQMDRLRRRALGRPDLAGRERGLRLADADWREGTGRAMAIVPGDQDATMVETLRSAGWVVTSEIREPDGGAPTFYVLTRG